MTAGKSTLSVGPEGGPHRCARRRSCTHFRLREQTVLDQPVGADEQRIAGKRREALIRRVAVARRSERQHLPQPLPAGGEEVDELEGGGAEVADPEAARQRRGVQQDAARARERHDYKK